MKKARDERKRDRGFTLVELIVVVSILALLIGLLTPKILNQAKRAKITIAHSQLEKIKLAVERASLDTGRYPSTEEGLMSLTQTAAGLDNWNGPYLDKKDLVDPWGSPIVYRYPCQHGGAHEFDLLSMGPNKMEDQGVGGDDIRSWE